jgi:hypothetical protein
LLFLIYINDIGEKLLSLSKLFADDTSLGYSSQNVVEIENVINHDSKALKKSQNKKQLNSFFSSELIIELYSSNNWWIVECFGRKPD